MLIDVRFRIKFIKPSTINFLGPNQFGKLLERTELGAEVKVVQESVFIISYVDKGGIQTGDNFLNNPQINISYGKLVLC